MAIQAQSMWSLTKDLMSNKCQPYMGCSGSLVYHTHTHTHTHRGERGETERQCVCVINADENKNLQSVNVLSVIDNISFSKCRFMKMQLLGPITGSEQIQYGFYPKTIWNKKQEDMLLFGLITGSYQ